jgi:hypothetical protein
MKYKYVFSVEFVTTIRARDALLPVHLVVVACCLVSNAIYFKK